MSAYASLPGSFLPPFFAFGAPCSPSENDGPEPKTDDGVDTPVEVGTSVLSSNDTQQKDTPASPSSSVSTSAFKVLSLSSETDDSKDTASPPSQPSDIVIDFQSARVDPVQLIKSLTSKGSNIARRTANFIARTPDVGESSTASESESTQSATEKANAEKKGSSDEVSVFSGPDLCYDSDSDEEYSMYDYSDDFSTPNDDEEDDSDYHRDEQNSSDGDPSAIEFDLAITFQGRKYNAKRGYPTFVKLREDLLHELNNNDRRSRRTAGGSKSPIHSLDTECTVASQIQKGKAMNERFSVPELPRVSPESLGHGGYAQQVARSGFALLQATAQHYCPEMESWMRQVIHAFPCSQSLSSFLWEPLSSSNAGWETIGEDDDSCNDNGQQEKISHSDAGFAKPPRGTRSSKAKSSTFSKNHSKYKSMGSMGSLNSIDEGNGGDDCECDDDW